MLRVLCDIPDGFTHLEHDESSSASAWWSVRPYNAEDRERWAATALARDLAAGDRVLHLSSDRELTIDGWPFERRVASVRCGDRPRELRLVALYIVHEQAVTLFVRARDSRRLAAAKALCRTLRFELPRDISTAALEFWSADALA